MEVFQTYRERVTACFKRYIETGKILRARPESWKSVRAESPEFRILSQAHVDATKDLWYVTDCEYSVDGFRNFVWEWRYWKVMSRQCTYNILKQGNNNWSGDTMRKLHEAEYNLAVACGLEKIYETPCKSIEKMFPNLRSSTPSEGTTTTTRGSWWTAIKNWVGTIGIVFSFGLLL